MTKLNWHSLPYDASKVLVKGTELAQAIIPGTRSRFAVVETRSMEADGTPGLLYRLRDAETVSDADVAKGIRPHIVGVFPTAEEAVAQALAMCPKEEEEA